MYLNRPELIGKKRPRTLTWRGPQAQSVMSSLQRMELGLLLP
jgi:hypothetical protein